MPRTAELKAFFKERVETGGIRGVRMNYVSGNPPELVLFDTAGVERDRIHVEGESVEAVEDLLASYGFPSGGASAKAELR